MNFFCVHAFLSKIMNVNKDFIFIESHKGKPAVVINGHRYNKCYTNPSGTTFWRCFKRNVCSASVTLSHDNTKIIRQSLHACRKNNKRCTSDTLLQIAKEKVCLNMNSLKNCYEESIIECQAKYPTRNIYARPYESVKHTLLRARRSYLKTEKLEFLLPQDVKIPPLIGENFLVAEYGHEQKIFVFCSNFCKTTMQKYARDGHLFFGDGTFKRVPKPFKQVFSVLMDLNSDEGSTNIVPVLYCLLPNKLEESYTALFTIIRDVIGAKIQKFKCDYELGLINAVTNVFPLIQLSGCYYHFNRAIWKNAKKFELTDTREGHKVTKLTSILPFVPADQIEEAWLTVRDLGPACREMNRFTAYFEKQWLRISAFISCAGQRHATNNAVEAFHRRLNTRMTHKPTLFKFLFEIKKDNKLQEIKIRNTLFTYGFRKKRDMTFLKKSKAELRKYIQGEVTVLEYLEKILQLRNLALMWE